MIESHGNFLTACAGWGQESVYDMLFEGNAMTAVCHDMRLYVSFQPVDIRRGLCVSHVLCGRIARAVRVSVTCCTSVFHVLCVGRMHLLSHCDGSVTLLDGGC